MSAAAAASAGGGARAMAPPRTRVVVNTDLSESRERVPVRAVIDMPAGWDGNLEPYRERIEELNILSDGAAAGAPGFEYVREPFTRDKKIAALIEKVGVRAGSRAEGQARAP